MTFNLFTPTSHDIIDFDINDTHKLHLVMHNRNQRDAFFFCVTIFYELKNMNMIMQIHESSFVINIVYDARLHLYVRSHPTVAATKFNLTPSTGMQIVTLTYTRLSFMFIRMRRKNNQYNAIIKL